MSDLNYDYYETRIDGWLYLYRGQEITCLYFSSPLDLMRHVLRISKLQKNKITRVQAADATYKNGRRERRLTPHVHDFINQVH